MPDYKLKITNTHGIIGIKKNDAVLKLGQPRAKMKIETKPPRVEIKTKLPQVRIDQSRCFSEAGLKKLSELTDELAERGRQAALESIAQTVAEGNRMADIKIKTDAIGEIAAAKVFRPPDGYNFALIPKSRPKIDFVGGISFNPKPAAVNIDVVPMPPEINATSPKINYYWKRQPFFSFEFVGKNIDVNA